MPRDEKAHTRVKSRFWMITSFEESPPMFDSVTMHFMRYAKEVCPTTGKEHWHGAVQFRDPIRFKTVQYCFKDKNLGPVKGNNTEFYAYTMKEGAFVDCGTYVPPSAGERTDLGEVVKDVDAGMSLYDVMRLHPAVASKSLNYVKLLISQRDFVSALGKRKHRFGGELREWQQTLKTTIEEKPDDRSVHWYLDLIGNQGKSYMCGYLQSHYGAFVTTGGKTADIAHAYNNEPIVIFDLPRSMEKSKDIYVLIEGFKNGCVFSPKYDSTCKIFDVPHVIVFSNFEPELKALSADRWKIYKLEGESIKDDNLDAHGIQTQAPAQDPEVFEETDEEGEKGEIRWESWHPACSDEHVDQETGDQDVVFLELDVPADRT